VSFDSPVATACKPGTGAASGSSSVTVTGFSGGTSLQSPRVTVGVSGSAGTVWLSDSAST
jgi:hypothetical protein